MDGEKYVLCNKKTDDLQSEGKNVTVILHMFGRVQPQKPTIEYGSGNVRDCFRNLGNLKIK